MGCEGAGVAAGIAARRVAAVEHNRNITLRVSNLVEASFASLRNAVLILIAGAGFALACERVQADGSQGVRLVPGPGLIDTLDLIEIGPFPTGRAEDAELVASVCAAWRWLANEGASLAFIVGRHDERKLTHAVRQRHRSNERLAMKRADWVKAQLESCARAERARIGLEVVTLAGAPRHSGAAPRAYAADRSVEVYGFRAR